VRKGTPVACSASTTRRLNPQRGAAGSPFMKSSTPGGSSSALIRDVTSSGAADSASLSDPSADISSTMSQPPSSSPLTYSCGNVGQSEYVFSPCRTSSSPRMSKVRKGTPVACSASTTRRLNPQRASSALPFMKSSTPGAASSALMRAVTSCVLPGAGATVAGAAAGATLPPASCFTLPTSAGTSAPSRVSTCLPFLRNTTYGTEATLYFSDTS